MFNGSNAGQTREFNRRLVLELIRQKAPVTRIEIARLTGLTPATVTNITAQLIQEGFVLELGRRAQGRGQPPVELDINPKAAYTVGLHLDRDVLSGVLVDLKGTIIADTLDELEPPSPAEALERLQQSFSTLIRRAAGIIEDKLLGIGVVTVGPLDIVNGYVREPPNFPGWIDVPLRQQLADATGYPVYLDNNATAAAIGEHWYGVGRQFHSFLYVYIGLGVGGGLFFNGRVHRGTGLNAGEIGHMYITPGDATTPPQTLEDLASILALRRDLDEAHLSLDDIEARFAAQEPRLLRWLERAAKHFARTVASVDNLLDLEAIIFGGRFPKDVLEYLVSQVRTHIDPFRMKGRPRYATVEVGRAGDDTAALGAATLPIYDAFIPRPNVVQPEPFKPSLKAHG